jgi:hypothetical protein
MLPLLVTLLLVLVLQLHGAAEVDWQAGVLLVMALVVVLLQ